MTQEIIEMARQSGWTDDLLEVSFVSPMLEAFANLVAAKAFQNGYEKGVAAFTEAVNLEREACAKVADEYATWGGSNFYFWFKALAKEIRARGEA
tara:strand:- start:186 stop:470 length:285 start_codon:yes stop_codon:yes gene_type:complete